MNFPTADCCMLGFEKTARLDEEQAGPHRSIRIIPRPDGETDIIPHIGRIDHLFSPQQYSGTAVQQ